MKIAIGADHGGYPLKEPITLQLQKLGHQVVDVGAYRLDPADDYPDFALAVAQKIQDKQADRGIILCGSGVGACVAANKVHGVRASVCHDTYSAAQGVQHDAMNVLCLGARIVGSSLAAELVDRFVSAQYTGEARHQRRLDKVNQTEKTGHA